MVCGELQTDDQLRQEEERLNEQFAALGIQVEGSVLADEWQPFYLWPENVEAYSLFASLRTQWRHGFSGPTGLDYAAVLAHMRAVGIRRRKFGELYAAVRVMEQGALEGFAEMRARGA
jgi:hypothetical protein